MEGKEDSKAREAAAINDIIRPIGFQNSNVLSRLVSVPVLRLLPPVGEGGLFASPKRKSAARVMMPAHDRAGIEGVEEVSAAEEVVVMGVGRGVVVAAIHLLLFALSQGGVRSRP